MTRVLILAAGILAAVGWAIVRWLGRPARPSDDPYEYRLRPVDEWPVSS